MVDRVARQGAAAVPGRAPEGHASLHRRGFVWHPCVHPDADALVVDAQAHVDPWQLRQDPERRRLDAQLAADHLQFAEAFDRRERVIARLAVAGKTAHLPAAVVVRSEEHTSELQSLMRISYAVFCLKKKNTTIH